MTLSERATTRITQGFADFINSLSENENAAMRALMLIGANEVGIDPTLVADDLRLTMGARLPLEIVERLVDMLSHVDHAGVAMSTYAQVRAIPRQASAEARTPIETSEQRELIGAPQASDPFDSIGFDFDDTSE